MSSSVPHINGPVSRRIEHAVSVVESGQKVPPVKRRHAESIATLGAVIQGLEGLAQLGRETRDELHEVRQLAQDSNDQLHSIRANPVSYTHLTLPTNREV